MFTLKQNSPTCGDCTASYNVILDKEYTVIEFIMLVLVTLPNNWGKFVIDDGLLFNYSNGSIFENISQFEFGKELITSITANGGYSKMDYNIKTK